jgi:hypothetical protein
MPDRARQRRQAASSRIAGFGYNVSMHGRVQSKQDESANPRDKLPELHPDPEVAPPPPEEIPNPEKVPANEGGTADAVYDHRANKQ